MKEDELGALWLKEGKNGKYMSGRIEINGEKINIVVFKNNYKEKENQPDYKILRSRPKTDAPQQTADTFEDDIPF